MGKIAGTILGVVMGGVLSMPASGTELDIMKPRVPADQIAQAKATKPPIPVTADEIAKGKDVFTGVGTCFTCHGVEGKGNGAGATGIEPSPRNFTNHTFDQIRTSGEMLWVITNGSPLQPQMLGFVTLGQITTEQAWEAILYERSLGCGGDMDCIAGTAEWVSKQPVHENPPGQ